MINQSVSCELDVKCLFPYKNDTVSVWGKQTECTFKHTTDLHYRQLSTSLPTPTTLHVTPGSKLFLEFSMIVNDTLLIVERLEYNTTEGEGNCHNSN